MIERLSEVRQDRGASASEEETAKRKIKELLAKNEKQEKILIVDRYPEYQPNPPKMSWHVEKDGTIIAKDNGIGKFSQMKYFNKEYYQLYLTIYLSPKELLMMQAIETRALHQ